MAFQNNNAVVFTNKNFFSDGEVKATVSKYYVK